MSASLLYLHTDIRTCPLPTTFLSKIQQCLNKVSSFNSTYNRHSVVSVLFAAASPRCRAFSVQRKTRLWSWAERQKAASWHHTCNSVTESVQFTCDAVVTSLS